MAAKLITTYIESLYEGPAMGDEISRIVAEKRTGFLTVNFICGGVGSIKWTEKGTTVRSGNGENGKFLLTEQDKLAI